MVRSCKLLPTLAREGVKGHKPWELLAGNIIIKPGTLVAFSRTGTLHSWPIAYCGAADVNVARVRTEDILAYLKSEGLWHPFGPTATVAFAHFLSSHTSSHLTVVRLTHIYDMSELHIDLRHKRGAEWTLPFAQTTAALARFGVYRDIRSDKLLVASRIAAWVAYFRGLLTATGHGDRLSRRVRLHST